MSGRSKVHIINNGNLVVISSNNGIITKAQNLEYITPSNYEFASISENTIWLGAGTWYFIESNQNYQEGALFIKIN